MHVASTEVTEPALRSPPTDWPRCLDEAWAREETFVVSASDTHPLSAATHPPPAWLRGHVVLTTSGSTGAPRQVVLARERLEALARVLTRVQRGDDVETVIVALPLHYSFAFVNQWLWARVSHRTLVTTPGFREPNALARALDALPSSMLCLVGAQGRLAAQLFGGRFFPNVCRVHFAGGPFPASSYAELTRIFPRATITNNYGCTEAGPRLTTRAMDLAADPSNVGFPLPGVELTQSEAGTVRFRSPFQAVGIGEAGTWRAIADDEWLDTDDVGEARADGSWRLLGRRSEVVKRHGEKVAASSILAAVRSAWPGEAECVMARDAAGEPGFVLVVAPTPSDSEVRAMLGTVRALPRASWPLAIDSVEALPTTGGGKVDRLRLERDGRTSHWRQR